MSGITDFRPLPETELTVMQAVWAMEEAGETEIHAGAMMAFSETLAKWKLTTVLTLVTRLTAKGFLTVRKVGRFNCYTSRVSQEAYNRTATREFVSRVWQGRAGGFLSSALGGETLTKDEIAELRAALDAMEKQGGQNR